MLNRARTKAQVVRQPSAHTITTTLDYDWVGDKTYTADPVGDVTTQTFDAAGDVTSVTDAVGFTTTTTFDAFGDTVGTKVPDGTMTGASFDQAGRQLASSQLGMAGKNDPPLTTVYGYDDAGNRTTVTTPAGRATQTAYDAENRVISTTIGYGSPVATTTQSFYDAAGNNTRIRNGRGLDTIITYQSWNLQESRIEPATTTGQAAANRTFTTSYDAGGLKVKDTQPGAVSITRTFDDSGHVLTEVGAGATGSHTYAYDLDGRRMSISHPNATIGVTYDDRGLVLTTTGGNMAAGVVSTSNTYNDAGELTS
jgi:YD repeat-containing protein